MEELVWLVVLANFIMQVGNQAAYFVGMIGSATYTLEATAAHIAVLVAFISLLNVAGNALIGVPIDRLGPRISLVVTLVGYGVCLVAMALMPLTYISLLVFSSLSALFFGGCSTAIASFPAYLTDDREQLKNANSLVDTAMHVAIIAGPSLGAVISSRFDVRSVFGFGAAMLFLSAVVAWSLEERVRPSVEEPNRFDQEAAEPASRGFASDFMDGLAHAWGSVQLRTLLVAGFFGFFAYGAFDSLESLYYRDVLRVGVEWMGWLSMLSGVGSVVGSVLLLHLPEQRVNFSLLAVMLFVTGAGSMLYVGTDQVTFAAVGQAICGLGFGVMMPVQHLLVQESCDLAYLGRVSGVMRVALNLSGVLPLAIAPWLSSLFGVQPVLFFASTFVACVGIFFVFYVRSKAELA